MLSRLLVAVLLAASAVTISVAAEDPAPAEAGVYNCYAYTYGGSSVYAFCRSGYYSSAGGNYVRAVVYCSNLTYGYAKATRYGPWKGKNQRSWAHCPSQYPNIIYKKYQRSSW